jgi:protein-disulfide isomerase
MSDRPRRTISNQLVEPPSERDHTQGPSDAAVTLVTYGDFECPYCVEAYRAVEQLRGEMDDVQFVFRHFPLDVHPHAWQAAEAAEAAAAQGTFWEMHDLLYEHPDALETDNLRGYAEQLGLDGDYLIQEIERGAFTGRVQDDVLSGARSGVNGTPTFFIDGERYDQQWDADILRAALEDAMWESDSEHR